MIPSVVARQIRRTVLDYLETTFALSDEGFEQALFEHLNQMVMVQISCSANKHLSTTIMTFHKAIKLVTAK